MSDFKKVSILKETTITTSDSTVTPEMTNTEQSVIDAMDTEFDGVGTFDIVQALLGLRTRLEAADKELALHKSGARMKELEGKNRDLRKRIAEQRATISDYRKWRQTDRRTILELNKRIAELEELAETVQLSCNPPKDCTDVEVLKTYMLTCYAKAVEVSK